MKEKGIEKVNVKNVLLEMRNYRMGLIQTPEQLRFSYIAIIQGLKVDWDAKNNVSQLVHLLLTFFYYSSRP